MQLFIINFSNYKSRVDSWVGALRDTKRVLRRK